MLTRKKIEEKMYFLKENFEKSLPFPIVQDLAKDALAKHDALLEIYHLLGGEGEPEDVVEACKKLIHVKPQHFTPGHPAYIPSIDG